MPAAICRDLNVHESSYVATLNKQHWIFVSHEIYIN